MLIIRKIQESQLNMIQTVMGYLIMKSFYTEPIHQIKTLIKMVQQIILILNLFGT